jgi:hypothetical protein
MTPNDKARDDEDDSEEPLENQPLEWADENREIEDRKPDFGGDGRGYVRTVMIAGLQSAVCTQAGLTPEVAL